MINTYNETELHKTLKTLYSLDEGSRTEVESDGKIYDIVKADGSIVEIQTKNLAKMLGKVSDALAAHRHITVVYPLVLKKYIERYDDCGTLLSRRKSPRNGSLYDLFDELTGLYPVLLEPQFSLEVLEITLCEKRLCSAEPVQSPNGRRRFLKNWNKTGKSLEEITATRRFTAARDYLSLIPETCLPEFCVKDIAAALRADRTLPASAAQQAGLLVWVLARMNLIEVTAVKNRSRYFRIVGQKKPRGTRAAVKK